MLKKKQLKIVLKNIRISPYKIRLVVDIIKKKNVLDAISILKIIPNKSSFVLIKLLMSAISNFKNNNKLLEEKFLIIKNIFVDEGPVLKRSRFRAKGSIASILKRSSYITINFEIIKKGEK